MVEDHLVGARRIQHELEVAQRAVENHIRHGRGYVALECISQAAGRELQELDAASGSSVSQKPRRAVTYRALESGAGPAAEVEDETVLFVEDGGAGGVKKWVGKQQVVREGYLCVDCRSYLDRIREEAKV